MGLRNYSKNPVDSGSSKRGFLAQQALREIAEADTKLPEGNLFFLVDTGLLRRLNEPTYFEKNLQINAAYSQRDRQVEAQKKRDIAFAYLQKDNSFLADKDDQSDRLWEQWESYYLPIGVCERFNLKNRGFLDSEIEAFEDYESQTSTDMALDIQKAYSDDLDLFHAKPSMIQLADWARNNLEQRICNENGSISVPGARMVGYMDISSIEDKICPFDRGDVYSLDEFNEEQDLVACGGSYR